jgi:thiol:disulfide interchange protein DsbD
MGAIVLLAASLYLFGGLMGTLRLPGWIQGLLPPRTAYASSSGGLGGNQVVERPRPDWADESFHAMYGGNWWTTDHDRALELGRKHGRRVFLNFTGIFCTNCRTMEQGLFLDPEVTAEFDEMVLADLYTDIPNEAQGAKFHTTVPVSKRNNELRSKTYGTTANPHYVILSPGGEIIATSGYEANRETFLEFLRAGK